MPSSRTRRGEPSASSIPAGDGQPKARIGRPPGKSSAQTRAAILSAAREQFLRDGYERATNRAIAQQAGVTAAAIYQYFPSKKDLYVAAIAEAQAELMPRMTAAARQAPTARAALTAMLHEYLGIGQDVSSARFLASLPTELQRHPELAEAMVAEPGEFFALVQEVVRRGVRSGEIERARSEQVLAMYIAALIGLAIHGSTMPESHAKAGFDGFIALLEGKLLT